MGHLALAPAAVAFPIVFLLTYCLCVGPRRALLLTLAGVIPLTATAIGLDTGGTRGTCGPSCQGLKDAAPVVWWLALSWLLAVAAGTAVGAWRDSVDRRRATTSRATAAQPGA
ncbi:MAG: hypothetical protein QOD37_1971 [Gaiellales bacterium]|jgi:hypothetical protein|nr:hypothetical protein [Gaiellales bacterium]MDX6572664.1 hypothetical protein [Gaiellales bacterium]